MALLSRALNFPIAVRPPEANREWITRLLDCGVWNLHCPQVENAAHAAEIVAASRYAPRGLRGNAGHSPGTDYDMTGTAAERRAFANRQVFVTVMFETDAAFDDLDAIAAMDGIDALTIGPADLAQDLGVFGTPDQARVLDEKRDLVLAAAKKHGKTCAMLCSSYEQAQQWKEAGALLLAYSSDSEVLHGALQPRQWAGSRDSPPLRAASMLLGEYQYHVDVPTNHIIGAPIATGHGYCQCLAISSARAGNLRGNS